MGKTISCVLTTSTTFSVGTSVKALPFMVNPVGLAGPDEVPGCEDDAVPHEFMRLPGGSIVFERSCCCGYAQHDYQSCSSAQGVIT